MDVQKDHLDGNEEGFMPGYIFKVRIRKPRSSHVRDRDRLSASAIIPAHKEPHIRHKRSTIAQKRFVAIKDVSWLSKF